jgi:serine/threonine protein kinase
MVVPAKLGIYQLKKFLGEGSMGRVYLARDPGLERDVAIKILREDLNATPKMWSMLEEEAKSAAGIHHHNVIHIFTMGKVLGRPYIVMELATESTLEDLMRKRPLSEEQAIQVGLDVLHGLQAAAANQLMHGDVKPANILVGPPGHTKIADFGLARFMREGQPVERWGTPYYIAPEKSQQIQEDFRSDMYSLGATLFHAVAGVAPFEGESGEDVIRKSLEDTAPELHDVAPSVSTGFSSCIRVFMAKDPDHRFATYEEAIRALECVQEGEFDPDPYLKKKKKPQSFMKTLGTKIGDLLKDQQQS